MQVKTFDLKKRGQEEELNKFLIEAVALDNGIEIHEGIVYVQYNENGYNGMSKEDHLTLVSVKIMEHQTKLIVAQIEHDFYKNSPNQGGNEAKIEREQRILLADRTIESEKRNIETLRVFLAMIQNGTYEI